MKNFLKISILVIFFIFVFLTFKKGTDLLLEKQAKLQLQFIKINLLTKQKQYKTPQKVLQLIEAKYLRNNGPQADMFLYEPISRQVLWDASSDCKLKPSKSYLKKGSICSLFYNPESCVVGENILSNEKSGVFSWNFYKEKREKITFDNVNFNGKDYKIAIGGFESDVFMDYIYFIFSFLFFIVLTISIIIKR
jgi:hypothetical protein